MTGNPHDLSSADILASILRGTAKFGDTGGSIQRSHRFPIELFFQIENMAQMAGVPVSLIINQLIECGLEAVKPKLPPEKARLVSLMSEEQSKRACQPYSVNVNPTEKATPKAKAKGRQTK